MIFVQLVNPWSPCFIFFLHGLSLALILYAEFDGSIKLSWGLCVEGMVAYTGRKCGLSLSESFKVSQKFRGLSYLSVACS